MLGRCRAAVRGQDPVDPEDPVDIRDPRMGSLFRTLGVFCDRSETWTPPEPPWGPQAAQGGPGVLWGSSGALWEARGTVQKSLGGALGRPIYRETPDQPPQRPLC